MIIEKTMISGDVLQFMLGRRGAMTIINKSTNLIKNINIQLMSWVDLNSNNINDFESGETTFSTVATIPSIAGGARMTVYLMEGRTRYCAMGDYAPMRKPSIGRRLQLSTSNNCRSTSLRTPDGGGRCKSAIDRRWAKRQSVLSSDASTIRSSRRCTSGVCGLAIGEALSAWRQASQGCAAARCTAHSAARS